MQRREKILLIGLGAVMLLFAGRAVYARYVGALQSKAKEIANLEGTLNKIELERLEAVIAREKWLAAGAQTLSMEPTEATNKLRDELYELVRTTGLFGDNVSVGQATLSMRNGIRMLDATVSAEGDIGSMVQFLYRLYRQPYAVRCKSLAVLQAGGRGVPPGELKMTVRLETPILPANKTVPEIVPAVLDPQERREVDDRLRYADAAHYRTIVERNLWRPWEPPIPPPAKAANPNPGHGAHANPNTQLAWTPVPNATSYDVHFGDNPDELQPRGSQPTTTFRPPGLTVGTTYYWKVNTANASGTTEGDVWSFTAVEPQRPEPVVIVEPPRPPPPDGHLVLNRVLSSPRGQQAVAEDVRQPNNPNSPNAEVKRYEVGETLYGGTLVYVHPKGVVSELDGLRRFHAIGEQLQAHRLLNEQEHPEVYHEVLKLERQATGISRAPD